MAVAGLRCGGSRLFAWVVRVGTRPSVVPVRLAFIFPRVLRMHGAIRCVSSKVGCVRAKDLADLVGGGRCARTLWCLCFFSFLCFLSFFFFFDFLLSSLSSSCFILSCFILIGLSSVAFIRSWTADARQDQARAQSR